VQRDLNKANGEKGKQLAAGVARAADVEQQDQGLVAEAEGEEEEEDTQRTVTDPSDGTSRGDGSVASGSTQSSRGNAAAAELKQRQQALLHGFGELSDMVASNMEQVAELVQQLRAACEAKMRRHAEAADLPPERVDNLLATGFQ
jgi:hypothetical protein